MSSDLERLKIDPVNLTMVQDNIRLRRMLSDALDRIHAREAGRGVTYADDVLDEVAEILAGQVVEPDESRTVEHVLAMGAESLNPDSYADLERIVAELRAVRQKLKED